MQSTLHTAMFSALVFAGSIASAGDRFWELMAEQNEQRAPRLRQMADEADASGLNGLYLRDAARLSEINAQMQRHLARRSISTPYTPITPNPSTYGGYPGGVSTWRGSNTPAFPVLPNQIPAASYHYPTTDSSFYSPPQQNPWNVFKQHQSITPAQSPCSTPIQNGSGYWTPNSTFYNNIPNPYFF